MSVAHLFVMGNLTYCNFLTCLNLKLISNRETTYFQLQFVDIFLIEELKSQLLSSFRNFVSQNNYQSNSSKVTKRIYYEKCKDKLKEKREQIYNNKFLSYSFSCKVIKKLLWVPFHKRFVQ